MGDSIKFKKGLLANLPTLDLSEPGYTVDEERLYIGGQNGNIGIAKKIELDNHINDIAAHGTLARQAIINGNFDIWQRGTSFNYNGTDYISKYNADRWSVVTTPDAGTLPNITVSKLALTPGELLNSANAMRIAWDGVGATLGTNSYLQTVQKIENGTKLLCGLNKKITLSLYLRSTIAGKKIGINVWQNYGTGGTPTTQEQLTPTNVVITSANTWQKVTLTFTTNTLIGKTFGTNNDDFISINMFCQYGSAILFGDSGGSEYVSAGNIDIAQVQVSASETPLPFSPRSFDKELKMCQRYYRPKQVVNFFATVTDKLHNTLWLTPKMRVHPTVKIYDVDSTTLNKVSLSSNNSVKVTIDPSVVGSDSFIAGVADSLNALTANSMYEFFIELDAEL